MHGVYQRQRVQFREPELKDVAGLIQRALSKFHHGGDIHTTEI